MPATPSQTLPVRLTNGINTKDDELLQVEMLNLENGTFQRPGSLRKRNGLTRFAAPSANTRQLIAYNKTPGNGIGELLAVADDGLFSRFINPANGWTASKGFPALTRTTETTVSSDFQNNTTNGGSDNRGMVLGDIAVAGGMCFCAWLEYNTTQNQCYVTVFDLVTGAQYLSRVIAVGTGQAKQVRWVYESTGGVVYLYIAGNTTTAARYAFSATTAPTAMPAATTSTFTDNPIGPFDAAARTGGGSIAVMAQGALYKDLRIVAGSPAVLLSQGMGQSIATATNTIRQCAVYQDPTVAARYWVVWAESDGAATSVIKVLASDAQGNILATAVTVGTLTNSTQPINVGVVWSAANGGPIVFWEDDLVAGEAKRLRHRQYSLSGATLTALAAEQLTMLWGEMLSRPFLIDGVPYIWAANMSNTVNGIPFYASAFLLRIDTTDLSASPKARVIAKALHRAAPSRLNNQSIYTATPSQVAFDGTDALLLAPKLIGTSGNFAQNAAYAPTVIRTSFKQYVDAAQLTKSICMGASLVQSFDGAQLVELNHLAPPEQVTAVGSSTGGSLSNGTYLFCAVYEWVDANGEIQQSLPSTIGTITLSGGTSTQSLSVSCRAPLLTAKSGIAVRIYLSLANQQSLFASAIGDASLTGVLGNATTGLITFGVIGSVGTAPLYSQSVLSNDAPQPTNFLAKVSDRIWGHSGQGVLEPTKKRIVTHAPEFSGLVAQQLSSFLAPNAMAEIAGNREVVFADEAIAQIGGDGPDNTGAGTFTDDELISRSVGCQAQRNLLRWDGGILFESKKGWHNLSDGLDLQYVGNKVEAYNGLAPAGIAYDPVSNRIKAALQGVGSPILVFDTYAQAWSLETSLAGIDCRSIVFWRDRMQLLDANGPYIWEQTPGLYTDNGSAIVMRGRTGWFAPADLLGFFYIKKLHILGEKKSDHNLNIVVRYNYNETIGETFPINAGPSVAAGPYVWGAMPKKQDAYAMCVEFYDDFTGYTPGEGYAIEGIALELGFEQGLYPLDADHMVPGV
jgi:hypothetical protein